MSGPSKFIVNLIVKLSRKLTRISPLHNRFKIAELMVLRSKQQVAVKPST